MEKKGQFEEIPTVRPGDRVLRRQRRPHGLRNIISQRLSSLLRRKANK